MSKRGLAEKQQKQSHSKMESVPLSYLTFVHFSCHINNNSLICELERLVVSIFFF